jgi:hypothetical protein
MAPIRISKMKTAAADLKRSISKLDVDKDGALSPQELRAGRQKVGDVTVHAINKFKASMVGSRWGNSATADGVNVVALKKAVDLSIKQLEAIDAYKGNTATHKKSNTKDGVVTTAEIKNYAHGDGKLQHFAEQIVWYAANKK